MPRRPAKTVALVGAALVAGTLALACNSILGNGDGHFVPDASTTADANDVTSMDASGSDTLDDASAADGSLADAGGAGFCASLSSAAAFCADFDDADDGGLFGFVSSTPGSGCSLTRDATNKSPPFGLHAMTTNSSCYLAVLVVPPHEITIDLDVRMHTLPGSPGADGIFTLRAGAGPKFTFFATKTSAFFQGNGQSGKANSDPLQAPVLDVFHHVHMALVLTAGVAPTISGTYDQTTITFNGGKPQIVTEGPFEPSTSTEVRIGMPDLALSNVGDVFIDNVLVRVQ